MVWRNNLDLFFKTLRQGVFLGMNVENETLVSETKIKNETLAVPKSIFEKINIFYMQKKTKLENNGPFFNMD